MFTSTVFSWVVSLNGKNLLIRNNYIKIKHFIQIDGSKMMLPTFNVNPPTLCFF